MAEDLVLESVGGDDKCDHVRYRPHALKIPLVDKIGERRQISAMSGPYSTQKNPLKHFHSLQQCYAFPSSRKEISYSLRTKVKLTQFRDGREVQD